MNKCFLSVAALLCIFTSCSTAADEQRTAMNVELAKTMSADTTATQFSITDDQKQEEPKQDKQHRVPQQELVDWDKKIVKTANASVEVKDYNIFSRDLNAKVKKFGGYISQEQLGQSDYKIENTVVIKVPVAQFDLALSEFTNDVQRVVDKQILSEEVTGQVVDGKSRLEAKKQVRLRYLELLKQAKNMEDILNIQREINAIQEEIELVSGRIQYLNQSSAMSTINLTFYQVLDPTAADPQSGFLTKIKAAFAAGWNWLSDIFIALISVWPLLIAIVAALYFFRKLQLRQAPKSART